VAENLTFNLDVDTGNAVNAVNTFFNTFEQGAAQAKSKLNTAFNQKLQTEVKVEFKGGKLVATEIQKIKQESNRLSTIYKAVNGELGKTPNQLKKQKSILNALLGDTRKFESGTRKVTAEWSTLTGRIKQVNSELKQMGTGGGGALTGLIAKFVSIQTIANLATAALMNMARSVTELVSTGVRMETLNLQMEAFTGGAAEAEAAMTEFLRIAANSPLTLEQVANAGKIMMAFGVSTDQAIESTEQLAVVSAATGGDVNLLARNLGQVAAQGRAYTRDLTQFAIQGVPIWEELSVVTGQSVTELKEMARTGKIGFQEVEQALSNMTAEGTAFAEVANRMQETFAGRLAAIEAAFQNLAGKMTEAFNMVDESLGGIVSGSMKLFADGLNLMAEKANFLVGAFAALTAGVAAYVAVMVVLNWGAIASAIGAIVLAVKGWAAAQATLNIAQAFFAGLTGNWVAIAAGVAAAGVAVGVLANKMGEAKDKTIEAQGGVQGLTEDVGVLNEKEMEGGNFGGRVEAYKKAREEADQYRAQLDIELEKLEEMKEALTEKHKEDVQGHKDAITAIKEKLEEEKASLAEAKAEIKAKYDDEKAALNETLSLIREKYSEEISKLQEMGPKQKELYELEKKKLQESIASGKLDQEAVLRAQARLERMEQQEEIARLRKKQLEEEKPVLESLEELEKQRKEKINETTEAHTERIRSLESDQDKEEAALKETQRAYDEQIKKMDEAAKAASTIGKEVKITSQAIDNQIGTVNGLASAWREAETAARDYASQVRAANSSRSGTGTASGARASGGPVAGGSTYTVNELGKEAFLSASGKLSMINAPAFGKWKAPASGTVIPAHLTRQLDVPKGGVNINKGASSATSGAAANGMNFNKIASAIAAAAGGDTVTNNVTIQATNTTQAATDAMVQLAKLKRLRYN
jgi:tape measure domain-containing protein